VSQLIKWANGHPVLSVVLIFSAFAISHHGLACMFSSTMSASPTPPSGTYANDFGRGSMVNG
jgi:hypothetical protein